MSLENEQNRSVISALGGEGTVLLTGTSAVSAPAGFYIAVIDTSLGDGSVDLTINTVVEDTNTPETNKDYVQADISGKIINAAVGGRWSSVTLSFGEGIGYLKRI